MNSSYVYHEVGKQVVIVYECTFCLYYCEIVYPFRSHMCLPQILAPVRLEDLMPIGAIDELEPSSSTLYKQLCMEN